MVIVAVLAVAIVAAIASTGSKSGPSPLGFTLEDITEVLPFDRSLDDSYPVNRVGPGKGNEELWNWRRRKTSRDGARFLEVTTWGDQLDPTLLDLNIVAKRPLLETMRPGSPVEVASQVLDRVMGEQHGTGALNWIAEVANQPWPAGRDDPVSIDLGDFHLEMRAGDPIERGEEMTMRVKIRRVQ